jgi:uncharacterized protein (DUF433 family)
MEVAMSEFDAIDWGCCPDVESVPGRCSGAWVVKGSRILVEGILDNAQEGLTAEEIANEVYDGLEVDRARRILDYARKHAHHPHPA